MQAHENAGMIFFVGRSAVNIITTEHHHAAGGDGDVDGDRQIFIHRLTGWGHANHVKVAKAISTDD